MSVDASQLQQQTGSADPLTALQGSLQSGQGLPPPSDTQVSNLEFQAQTLFQNSLAHTGQLPNPQFAAEALATGATPDVVSAYGDPVASPYLVAGAPGGTGASPPMNGPTGGSPNAYAYDPNQHQAYVQANMGKFSQYAGLGDIPLPNVGYFQSILHGDQGTVQKWQSYLSGLGVLDPNHANNGYMDQPTQNALQGYFIQLFTPQALFSKDSNAKMQATQFLQGIGFDPNTLNTQMYSNPQFTTEMALGWIQTQGQQDQKKALNDYADQFGQDALPKPLQDLVNPGILQEAENTGWSILAAPFNLIGMVASPITGGNKIAEFLNQISPQHGEEQNVEAGLKAAGTPQADINALQPALQKVQGDTGWLPFDFIDRQWNHLVLGTAYLTEDAVGGGHPDQVGNPFDPSSPMGMKIAAHENDLGAGLFGDQWAKDHPTQDQWFNFIGDSVDPVYWYGGWFGRAERLGAQLTQTSAKAAVIAGAKGITKVAEKLPDLGNRQGGLYQKAQALKGAPIASQSIRDVISERSKTALDQFLDPTGHMQRSFSDALMKVKDASTDDMRTMLRVFDPTSADEEALGAHQQTLDAMEQVKGAKSADEVIPLLKEHFQHIVNGPSALYNMRMAQRALTPNVIDRMGAGTLSKLRTLYGQTMTDGEIDLTKPYQSAQKIKQVFYIAGVEEPMINAVLNKWYAATPGERDMMLSQGGEVHDTIDKAILKRKGVKVDDPVQYKKVAGRGIAAVVGEREKIRSGGKLSIPTEVKQLAGKAPTIGKVLYRPTKTATGEVVEGSMVRQGNEATQKLLDEHQSMLDEVHQHWQENLTLEADRLRADNPAMTYQQAMDQYLSTEQGRAMRADYESQVNTIQKWSDQIAPEGATRPAPFLTSQERMTKDLPFDPYSLLVHLHKGKISMSSYETVASKLRMDYFHNKWKSLSLAQPSTIGRVAIGDDLIRPLIDFAQDGHMRTALRTSAVAGLKGWQAVGQRVKGNLATGRIGQRVLSKESVGRWQEQRKASEAAMLANPDFVSTHQLMNQWDSSRFEPFHPGDEAYPEAFAHSLRVHARAPEMVEYMKGVLEKGGGRTRGIERATKFYEEDPRAQERLQQHQASPAQMAEKLADFAEMLYPRTQMKRWVVKGNMDAEQMQRMLKNHPEDFHPVSSPKNTLQARNGILKGLKVGNPLNFMFHDVMEPFVNAARGQIGMSTRDLMEQQIRGMVGDSPNWSEARIKETASAEARAWMQNNLYQGQRSLAGTALRHAFPFYGATANMSKFFFRQWEKHPATAASWQRLFAYSETQANAPSDPWKLPTGVLSALGFSPQDTLSVNPSRMFFFTSDGFASFVPGLGPLATPLMGAIAKDPHLNALVGSIPGMKEQLAYHAGQSDPLFSYIEKAISGVGLISPLHQALTVPVFGASSQQIQQQEDEKFAQMAADNQAKGLPPPTADEVKSALGKQMLTGQALSSLLPVPISPKISDERRNQANLAKDAFSQASTDSGRDAVKQKFSDMKPLLDYLDPRIPTNENALITKQMASMGAGTTRDEAIAALGQGIRINKDDIAQDNPWVLPYSTSMYQTEGGLPREPGLAGFHTQLQNGDIAVMSLDAYSNKMNSQWQITNGYTAYDKQIVGPKQAFLAATGVSTNSAEYKAFNTQVIQPRLLQLQQQYPAWYKQFTTASSTPSDLAGKALKAGPLNAVTTWEMLPSIQGQETAKSVMWRKAIFWRDQASNQITELQRAGAPKVETDQVMTVLQQHLQQLADENPAYASELQLHDFRHWQDVIDYETLLEKTYGLNPNTAAAA